MLFECLLVVSFLGSRCRSSNVVEIRANFSQEYDNAVRSDRQITYWYRYQFGRNQNSAIRVKVNSINATKGIPILFVVRQQQAVISWQVPLVLENIYEYRTVGHTLCPLQNYLNSDRKIPFGNQNVYIDVSSASNDSVTFSLCVKIIKNFVMSNSPNESNPVHVEITPSQPQYFEYQFPPNVDVVLVHVTSDDDQCMVVSVQDIKCPIFDLDRNIEFRGLYQTMSRQAGITVQRKEFQEGRFYVVLLLKPTNADCLGVSLNHPDGSSVRSKNITVKISPSVTKTEYYEAVFEAICFFIIFYVLSVVISAVYYIRDGRNASEASLLDRSGWSRNQQQGHQTLQNYGAVAITNNDGNNDTGVSSVVSASTDGNDSDSSLDETDVDMLHDVDEEKDVFRTKTFLYVADLARKKEKKLRKKTKLYTLNLLTIAVFYGVPVLQLVYTYQTVLNVTGNEDICYYNFLCAHPLGVFSDFNHVFSNIGYIMLGILFLLLVWRRDILHKKAVDSNCHLEKFYGIPQHFGLFYAMGLALIMEGILSGCYHVCPNYSNFQFDTAFMYVIASLCMLKIYQTRHPDINAHSHSSYLSFAIVVVVGVLGVLNGSWIFWIVFTVAHVLCCLALSAQIYYMGRWKLNFGIFKRMYLTLRNDLMTHFTRPMYMDRLVLLIIANFINWSWSFYGLIILPRDFASYLLAIFITNLLLYLAFYIIMKLRHKEKILPPSLTYIILSMITWGAALYFFSKKNITWQKSPALSRENNKKCLLVNFYDGHDVWHFLSSAALFFSFMTLLTLDDDLIFTPRDAIPVF
ncbi:SID1 transmembrane family member 1-like isoform X3 [Centruroides sculpturatus]|uniref:SID1 transmembrane family member 1-like isoform X3 n=1 Tax=Centruroides sculpturatus TaxID=218467 RepID=UPI000C6D9A20|nr:SID1 transmembrane family member 1-like isoform X3 [Centruroides sculpturatus]